MKILFHHNVMLQHCFQLCTNKHLYTPSSFALGNLLFDLFINLDCPEYDVRIFEIPNIKKASRKRKPSDPKGKTIKQVITEAIDYVVNKDCFYGNDIKIVSDNEPLLIMDAYGMQDALSYAISDCKNETDDSLFFDYCCYYGYEPWMNTMSDDEAVGLLKYFFDKYYPKVKDRNIKASVYGE